MSNGKKKPLDPGKTKFRLLLPNYKRGCFYILIITVVIVISIIMLMCQRWQNVEQLRFDQFQSYVENGYVDCVTVKADEIVGCFNDKGVSQLGDKVQPSFVVYYKQGVYDYIDKLLRDNNVKIDMEKPL